MVFLVVNYCLFLRATTYIEDPSLKYIYQLLEF